MLSDEKSSTYFRSRVNASLGKMEAQTEENSVPGIAPVRNEMP
jgi:hypothetical protein